MKKEKRLKTKVIQIRVTPEKYKIYDDYAKEKCLTKTELFDIFLEQIEKKII